MDFVKQLEELIVGFATSVNGIAGRRSDIRSRLMDNSPHLRATNFSTISGNDLQLLMVHYDDRMTLSF